jgi:hypothetical protein
MKHKTIEVVRKFLSLENDILKYSCENRINELVHLVNSVSYKQLRQMNRIKYKTIHKNISYENIVFYVNREAKISTIERVCRTRINHIDILMMDTVCRNDRNYDERNRHSKKLCTNIDRIIKDELVIEPCNIYLKYFEHINCVELYKELSVYINENRYYLVEEDQTDGIRGYLNIGLSIIK